jgi:hypothetical protein
MKLFLLAITFFAFLQGHTQVANTKWQGSIELDSTTKVILHFSKDTLTITSVDDSKIIEILTFAEKGNILLLQKVNGKATDCDKRDVGIYKFDIRDNAILFALLEDDCNTRSAIIEDGKWLAIKEE